MFTSDATYVQKFGIFGHFFAFRATPGLTVESAKIGWNRTLTRFRKYGWCSVIFTLDALKVTICVKFWPFHNFPMWSRGRSQVVIISGATLWLQNRSHNDCIKFFLFICALPLVRFYFCSLASGNIWSFWYLTSGKAFGRVVQVQSGFHSTDLNSIMMAS